mgnify:CR=1 FL=1
MGTGKGLCGLAFAAETGRDAAMASAATRPKDSPHEGMTTRSSDFMMPGTSRR